MFHRSSRVAHARRQPCNRPDGAAVLLAAILGAGGLCGVALAQPAAPAAAPDKAAAPAAQKPAVAPAPVLHLNVGYIENAVPRQTLDLAVPGGLSKGEKLPLIVWIHGGGWASGSKEGCPEVGFLADGFVIASLNYRLTDAAPWPAQIQDCKAAIRYLRAHASEYFIDPDRIGVWGCSAGGHLCAMLGLASDAKDLEGTLGNNEQSSRVQAVCDWAGPSDFLNFEGVDTATGGAVQKLLGGKVADKKDAAGSASPVTYCSKDDPPFLIMHGDKDDVVPVQQAKLLHDKLKEAGVDTTLDIIPDAGHVGGDHKKMLETVRQFFIKHLKKSGTTEHTESTEKTSK